MQLHIFTDASEQAIGAAVYARVINEVNTVVVSLVTAKSKVASVKQMTIPRLELAAALLGAQLCQYVKRACCWSEVETHFWSDSTIVIYLIRRDPDILKPYVAHRVLKIRQITNDAVWRHVEGTLNPADLLTRNCSTALLKKSTLWFNGPHWLSTPQADWPVPAVTSMEPVILDLIKAENKHDRPQQLAVKSAMVFHFSHYQRLTVVHKDGKEDSILNRHSELNSVLRIIGYVLRFISSLKRKVKQRIISAAIHEVRAEISQVDREAIPQIDSIERRQALSYWVRLAQQEAYHKEIIFITRGESIRHNSSIIKLKPFLDSNGALRVGGRLTKAVIPNDAMQSVNIALKFTHCQSYNSRYPFCDHARRRAVNDGLPSANILDIQPPMRNMHTL